MSDDIVTRLRERAIVLFSNGADGNAFIDEHAADEIERLRADRDRWKQIAAQLVSGAEHQIDDLRFPKLPITNRRWIEAWKAYDEAVHGE